MLKTSQALLFRSGSSSLEVVMLGPFGQLAYNLKTVETIKT
jgi:hypothetical protein